MKTVVFVLLVSLVVSQSGALRCRCGGLKICPSDRVETCHNFNDLCGSVIITAGQSPNYFKGCMSASQCATLNRPGISSAVCCRTDLCNR